MRALLLFQMLFRKTGSGMSTILHFVSIFGLTVVVWQNKLKIKCRAKGCSCVVDWGTLNVYSTLYHPGLVENDDDSDSDPESEDEQSESDDEQDAKPKEEKQKTKLGPGCDIHEKEPQLAPSKRRFLACMDQFTKRSKTVLPSAKILHVQELLRKWQLDAPDDKVIGELTLQP